MRTQPQPISVKPLTGDVYFVRSGANLNTGLIVGKTEVIVAEAKMNADSACEQPYSGTCIASEPSFREIGNALHIDQPDGAVR